MMLWNEMANQGWLSGGRMLNEWRDPEYAMPGYQASQPSPFLSPMLGGRNIMDGLGQNNPGQNYAQTGVAGYEQGQSTGMTTQPQNPLAKLVSGAYSGPQNRSMWQGYAPKATPSYRFGG